MGRGVLRTKRNKTKSSPGSKGAKELYSGEATSTSTKRNKRKGQGDSESWTQRESVNTLTASQTQYNGEVGIAGKPVGYPEEWGGGDRSKWGGLKVLPGR